MTGLVVFLFWLFFPWFVWACVSWKRRFQKWSAKRAIVASSSFQVIDQQQQNEKQLRVQGSLLESLQRQIDHLTWKQDQLRKDAQARSVRRSTSYCSCVYCRPQRTQYLDSFDSTCLPCEAHDALEKSRGADFFDETMMMILGEKEGCVSFEAQEIEIMDGTGRVVARTESRWPRTADQYPPVRSSEPEGEAWKHPKKAPTPSSPALNSKWIEPPGRTPWLRHEEG